MKTAHLARSLRPLHLLSILSISALASCGPATSSGPGAVPSAGADWEELARARTPTLPDAPTVALEEVTFLPLPTWSGGAELDAGVAMLELVGAGLLRRADVRWVERRRFGAAVDRERRRQPAPAGAPPVGESPGARWVFGASVVTGADSTLLDLRLVEAETGQVVHAWRSSVSGRPGAVALARELGQELRRGLTEVTAVPDWTPPRGALAPDVVVPESAVLAFTRGIEAEDRYDWEAARAAYTSAIRQAGGSFAEADEALARVARMRLGSPLGGG